MSTDIVPSLPGASATGLDLPKGLSYDEWASVGQALGHLGRAVQWWLGDWLLYGEHRYGEKFAQAASETGVPPESLTVYQWVASRFPKNLRRLRLSWSHHQVVAALPPDEATAWLDKAEAGKMSVHELQRQAKPSTWKVCASKEPGTVEVCDQAPLDSAVIHFAAFLAETVVEEIEDLTERRKDLSPPQIQQVHAAVEKMTLSLNGWRKR